MDAILAAAEQYGLVVIEDATESLGARYKNRNVGNLGNIACLSFNGNKIMTTGGGGMIVTDNAEWAERARYLTTQAKDDALEYIHHEIGYNYRMTNLAAAVGCGQLERLDQLVAAKRRIAAAYERGLSDIPGIGFMREADWAYSTWWMYTVLVDEGQCSVDSRQLLRYLGSRRIQARPLWQPMHLSPAYNGVQSYHCDTAKQLWERGLSLPCSTGLTESDQQSVIATIRSCMNW
jgi:perosamine synthetase